MSSSIKKGIIKVCENDSIDIDSGNIDHQSFKLNIKKREAIKFYIFNSLMFPIESKRVGIEEYKFEGPRVGMYYDTVDPREGTYINHFINKLSIRIKYDSLSASFSIKGEANLSDSSFDEYWYKGETSGLWYFEAKFIHTFKQKF
ncbi:MAG: hypothetical protein ACRBBR_08080 [Cellvibrionaceae bacterium]